MTRSSSRETHVAERQGLLLVVVFIIGDFGHLRKLAWGPSKQRTIVVVCSANRTGWTSQPPCVRALPAEMALVLTPVRLNKHTALHHPFCSRSEQRLWADFHRAGVETQAAKDDGF